MKLGSTAIAILVVGFLATFAATYFTYNAAHKSARQAQDFATDAVVGQIGQRMERIDIKLRALRALFSVDRTVSDNEFEEFAQLLSQPAYVKALQFVRIVKGDKLDAYQAVQRSTRKYPFQLSRRTGGVETGPVSPQDNHYIVEFVYPYAGNERALGLDVSSNPTSADAIERAIATKSVVSTESFYLVQNPDERALLVYLPIESHHLQDGSISVAGVAAVLVSLPSLSTAVQTDSARLAGLYMKDSGKELFLNTPAEGEWTQMERDINVVDRTWSATIETLQTRAPQNIAMLVLGFGSVLTLLALGTFEQSRLQQERQVVARLLDESEHNRIFADAIYRSLFESVGTANLEIEVNTGRILRANSQLLALAGVGEDELIGEPVEKLFAAASQGKIASALNKVREMGESSSPADVLLATDGSSQVWTLLSIGKPVANAGGGHTATVVMQDISAGKEYQRSRDILVRELAHRVRNTMQLMGSLADQTALQSSTVEAYRQNLKSRLHALSSAQDALFDSNWGALRLDHLVKRVLSPFQESTQPDRLKVEVEPIMVSAQEAQMIALAMHELGNNAAKYGALSQPSGRVELSISTEENGDGEDNKLHVTWREHGMNPAPGKPQRRGFGTIMLEKLLPRQFNGETRTTWDSDGMRFDAILQVRQQEPEAED